MRSTRGIAAFASFSIFTLAASGALAISPGAERLYRFKLQAAGGKVGDAVLSIGKTKKVGGIDLRAVSIDARTTGMGATVYRVKASGTTWVDSQWRPIRAHWEARLPRSHRVVDARYNGKHIEGVDLRNGKAKHKLNRTLKTEATDLVAAFAWLMQIDLTPGKTVTIPMYDGRFLYHLTAKPGTKREIRIPMGPRQAVPVEVTIRRGKRFKKKVTYYIDPRTRTPYKLSFSYGALGSVDALLTGEKRG